MASVNKIMDDIRIVWNGSDVSFGSGNGGCPQCLIWWGCCGSVKGNMRAVLPGAISLIQRGQLNGQTPSVKMGRKFR